MFHSSGSRHEQYLFIRSKNRAKATLHKKSSSLESEISGADSGYTSSSSTPSTASPTAITTPVNHVISTNNPAEVKTSTVDNTTTITVSAPPPAVKKKKSKKHQPPRQPDLVYSCPRPLAFPFHNDDHFLPIAEADPRDVARVSPSLNRSTSLQSSKTSVGSTRMYDGSQYSGHGRALDAESSYSRQSSILSTIQRGTVRSIRSLFQLPDSFNSSSNDKKLTRIDTNQTYHTRDSTSTRCTIDSHTPLRKLEIKKGTVQSIKDMFSKKRSSIQDQRVVQPQPRQQKGRVGTTIGQFESNMDYSRASIPNKKQRQAPAVAPKRPKSSLATRASEFASRALWKSAPKSPQEPPSAVKAAREAAVAAAAQASATKPLPKTPTVERKTIKSEMKKLSARITVLPKKWSTKTSMNNNEQGRVSLPVVTDPKPKRSLFSSFRRSDISASVDNQKKGTGAAKTAETEEIPVTPTKIGKMWKSFKKLVTGKKSSRVGVL